MDIVAVNFASSMVFMERGLHAALSTNFSCQGHRARLVSEDGTAGRRCSHSRSIVRINDLYYIGESNLDVHCLPIAFAYRKRYWAATSSATAVTVIQRYYENSNDNRPIWPSQSSRRCSWLIPGRHIEMAHGILQLLTVIHQKKFQTTHVRSGKY